MSGKDSRSQRAGRGEPEAVEASAGEASTGETGGEDSGAGGMSTIARAVGSAVGFMRRLVPVGETEAVRKKATGGERAAMRRPGATGGEPARRWVRREPAPRWTLFGRAAVPAEPVEARPLARRPAARAVTRGPVASEPALAGLHEQRAELEAKLAGLERELLEVYGAIASGTGAAGGGGERPGGLEAQSERARRLKEELDEGRLALVRAERSLARERLLRARRPDPEAEPARAAGPVRAAADRLGDQVRRAVAQSRFRDSSERLVFEELARSLGDADADIRREAAAGLGEHGSAAAYALLVAAADDPNERVRLAALNAIARLEVPEASGVFLRFVKDGSEHLRMAAVRGLGRVGDAAALGAVRAALEDGDAAVRKTAAAILGRRAAPESLTALALALRDSDGEVRATAAEALGYLGDERAVAPLIRAVGDRSAAVRTQALAALRMLVGDAVDGVIGKVADAEQSAALTQWWMRARVDRALQPAAAHAPAAEAVATPAARPTPAPVRAPASAARPGDSLFAGDETEQFESPLEPAGEPTQVAAAAEDDLAIPVEESEENPFDVVAAEGEGAAEENPFDAVAPAGEGAEENPFDGAIGDEAGGEADEGQFEDLLPGDDVKHGGRR